MTPCYDHRRGHNQKSDGHSRYDECYRRFVTRGAPPLQALSAYCTLSMILLLALLSVPVGSQRGGQCYWSPRCHKGLHETLDEFERSSSASEKLYSALAGVQTELQRWNGCQPAGCRHARPLTLSARRPLFPIQGLQCPLLTASTSADPPPVSMSLLSTPPAPLSGVIPIISSIQTLFAAWHTDPWTLSRSGYVLALFVVGYLLLTFSHICDRLIINNCTRGHTWASLDTEYVRSSDG